MLVPLKGETVGVPVGSTVNATKGGRGADDRRPGSARPGRATRCSKRAPSRSRSSRSNRRQSARHSLACTPNAIRSTTRSRRSQVLRPTFDSGRRWARSHGPTAGTAAGLVRGWYERCRRRRRASTGRWGQQRHDHRTLLVGRQGSLRRHRDRRSDADTPSCPCSTQTRRSTPPLSSGRGRQS